MFRYIAIFFHSDWVSDKGFPRESNQMNIEDLDEKLKLFYAALRKKNGNDYSKNTLLSAIEVEDLKKLKASSAISPTNPSELLMNFWFHITLYWWRKGREGQRNPTKFSFRFGIDENNKGFVTMSHDETSNNHLDGFMRNVLVYIKLMTKRMGMTPCVCIWPNLIPNAKYFSNFRN